MITQSPSATVVCVVSALRPASRTFRHLRPVSSHHVCSGRSSRRGSRGRGHCVPSDAMRRRHSWRKHAVATTSASEYSGMSRLSGPKAARARRTGADATVSSASSQV